ncbi:biotin/lipoate A/B protein ligase family protein [Halalkalibacterium halodurans]|jgi:octanoyl-[GcvH]:protein N-octanoyltransferase|uniref:Octanoyl-[GcvH]:protein N-octanoyltransferase n=1 Tax=Halalkalibacterium halodurans TaxID=86665 RepID=A0A0M0KGK7_ALKHA|nr:biotin/lipoate A/B protein ligase family protein [Halalkalibacterium halodurans]MED3648812.1 biotin/lipoate A/B protein ligase family protein [Halalkalibacterium halodurans]TPE69520.1 lipoate--protein ligase family protein [Halalkalibacterium halodurans]
MSLLLQQHLSQPWRFLDHTSFGPTFQALQSFAYDDTLCTSIGKSQSPPTLRAWVHHNTVVLGIQDSRLPQIKAGIEALKGFQHHVIVRNSGGLAVVLDSGILNLSLVLKEEKGFSIDDGYELMYELICSMFQDHRDQIEAREIVGSYCPGSYDLSIDGKKFAGISQRRIRGGVAVQIYLCVSGSGAERAKMIRTFYDKAVAGQPTKFVYPRIKPETMASLSELLGQPHNVSDVLLKALMTLQQHGASLMTESLSADEWLLYEQHFARISERNEKLLAE